MSSPDASDLVNVCRSVQLPRAEYQFYRAVLLVFPERARPIARPTLRQIAAIFFTKDVRTLSCCATERGASSHDQAICCTAGMARGLARDLT
ncbi:MAG TPA: hypothetical protein VKQ30_05810 [Ktedonobacterales bacterium]|nr:hypothetical protein [Ktedonobacterales bacterium]